MYGLLAQFISSSSALSKMNDLSFQRTAINSEYKSAGCTSSKDGGSGLIGNMLLRFIPTAACMSHKSELNGDTFASGVVVENVKEDTLPGVRVQRSSLEQRANAHISEQELNQWLEKETGMDRVRIMFSVGHDGTFIQEGTRDINTIFYRTMLLGSVACVVSAVGAEYARKQEIHPSNNQGVLKVLNERRVLRRIMTKSFKGTLRIAAFTSSLLYLSQAIAAYRNKSSVWEYAVASTLSFGLLDIGLGVKRCAMLALRGAVFGTLGGYVVCQILASNGMNQEQKHLECVRHHLQEQNRIKQTTQNSEGDRSLVSVTNTTE